MIKAIENRRYYAWFHIRLEQVDRRQIKEFYELVYEYPGNDMYDCVIEGGSYQVLLTPPNNTFHYTKELHLEAEHILGCGAVEAKLLEIHTSFQFDSPIEQSFWETWITSVFDIELVPQYPIGKYRVDFAHPHTKTAIELDGFASHSSTEDIANDRKRQREIEALGWHVIRFGGKEIYHDVISCAKEVDVLINRRIREYGQTPRIGG